MFDIEETVVSVKNYKLMIVAFESEQAFPVLMTSFNYNFQDFINSPFCP